MSNFDRALAVLEAARRPGEIRIHPLDAVGALAQAGLLAPDLPTMRDESEIIDVPVRRTLIGQGDDCVRYDADSALVGTWYGEVTISFGEYDDASAYMSIIQARELAYALLAAANYSEGQE